MARIDAFVAARVVDNKAISLMTLTANVGIRLLGSTVPLGTQRNNYDSGLSQVTIYPEPGKNGIVAVTIAIHRLEDRGEFVHWDYISAFLKVSWREKNGQEYPFVDLEEPWVPTDRMGQVTTSAVEVALKNGRRFCSYDDSPWDPEKTGPGYVPDGDLLCRYLWGTAHPSEVLHAAVQQKLEPTAAQNVARLSDKVQELKRERECLVGKVAATTEAAEVFIKLGKESLPLYGLLIRIPAFLLPKPFLRFIKAIDNAARQTDELMP